MSNTTLGFHKLILKITPLGLIGALIIGVGLYIAPASAALTLPTSCNDTNNEVIWCGAGTISQLQHDYNDGDGHNSAASIQNIYSYFGISANDINAMSANAVSGTVTKSGDVLVNGNVVATQAVTGGRQNIAGSTAVTYNGTTFYKRTPSISFVDNSLPAFVVMTNGRFSFAILSSCGNAVIGTPKPSPPPPKPAPEETTPNYTISKQVALAGSNNWNSEIQVYPNTKVDYKITITSTGSANVTNLVVRDVLPSDDTYDQSTLSLNGSELSQPMASDFFATGYTISSLAPNAVDTFFFEATAGTNQNNPNCTNETLINTASMQANSLPSENSTATVSIECVPATSTTAPKPASPKPTQLANTGPGNLVGVVAGTSIAGALGYGLLLRRRLTRNRHVDNN